MCMPNFGEKKNTEFAPCLSGLFVREPIPVPQRGKRQHRRLPSRPR